MGLQVKEKAIDKGKWSGRARPRTSPAQVCPVCLPLLIAAVAEGRSSFENQSAVRAPPGAWDLLTAEPAASQPGRRQSALNQMASFTSGISWLMTLVLTEMQQSNLSAGEGGRAGRRS